MKANCPGCKISLIRLAVQTRHGVQERWIHPANPLIKCDYSQDGIQVTTELVDEFLNDKFQELVKESEEEVGNEPVIVLESAESKSEEELITDLPDLVLLRQRLAAGEINIREYDAIEKRLKDNERRE